MTTLTPLFWKLTAERAMRAAASAVVGVLGSGGLSTIGNVPWYGVLSAAVLGALTSIVLSVASQPIDGTLPASFIKVPKVPRKRHPHPLVKGDPGAHER